MTTMVLYTPMVVAAMAAAPPNPTAVRALAEQLLEDTRENVEAARTIMIDLETLTVKETHGERAALLHNAMVKQSFLGGSLMDSATAKQVLYLSDLSKKNADPVPADSVVNAQDVPAPKDCPKCGKEVPYMGFRAHNAICTGKKGVTKNRPMAADRGRRQTKKK